MENTTHTHAEKKLHQALKELRVLYEVSAAMRTTLELDHILYIILTGVTAHSGLGYNRALLFLLNEKNNLLECKMALGPESGEDANRIWTYIEDSNQKLDDLIKIDKLTQTTSHSSLLKSVRHLKVPVFSSEKSLLKAAFERGTPWHVGSSDMTGFQNDPLLQTIPSPEMVIMPLRIKDKVIGLITADNVFTQQPISDDDLRIFTLLANHAALAIENSRLYEMVVLKSQQDRLTNLWNHGFFQEKLAAEIQQAKKTNANLTLIISDIDNFKPLNDTYGHQRGDLILKQLARIFQFLSRETDMVCRYGGEEFTIILPQTTARQGYDIAERLRQHIERQTFLVPSLSGRPDDDAGLNIHLTVSVGLATYPDDATDKDSLIAQADKALYMAKFSGKNKTSFVKK